MVLVQKMKLMVWMVQMVFYHILDQNYLLLVDLYLMENCHLKLLELFDSVVVLQKRVLVQEWVLRLIVILILVLVPPPRTIVS